MSTSTFQPFHAYDWDKNLQWKAAQDVKGERTGYEAHLDSDVWVDFGLQETRFGISTGKKDDGGEEGKAVEFRAPAAAGGGDNKKARRLVEWTIVPGSRVKYFNPDNLAEEYIIEAGTAPPAGAIALCNRQRHDLGFRNFKGALRKHFDTLFPMAPLNTMSAAQKDDLVNTCSVLFKKPSMKQQAKGYTNESLKVKMNEDPSSEFYTHVSVSDPTVADGVAMAGIADNITARSTIRPMGTPAVWFNGEKLRVYFDGRMVWTMPRMAPIAPDMTKPGIMSVEQQAAINAARAAAATAPPSAPAAAAVPSPITTTAPPPELDTSFSFTDDGDDDTLM